ncbi:MAG: protein translocase subunit SecF, partial [Gammaproteobacteria bacterium]
MRKSAFLLSGILIALSLASLAIRGLNFGIDFTGGTL